MYCAHSLINVATCHGMSNLGYYYHLVKLCSMNVYSQYIIYHEYLNTVILRIGIKNPWGFLLLGFLHFKYFNRWDSHVVQKKHRTPQNDGVGGWDSHVVQKKTPDSSEWRWSRMRLLRHPIETPDSSEWQKVSKILTSMPHSRLFPLLQWGLQSQ